MATERDLARRCHLIGRGRRNRDATIPGREGRRHIHRDARAFVRPTTMRDDLHRVVVALAHPQILGRRLDALVRAGRHRCLHRAAQVIGLHAIDRLGPDETRILEMLDQREEIVVELGVEALPMAYLSHLSFSLT